MKIYAQKGDYICALVESGDARLYRDINYLGDNGMEIVTPFNELAQADQEDWARELARSKSPHFVLLKDDELVGDVSIFLSGKTPMLASSLVTKPHRGQHLSELLLNAAMRYIAEETSFDSVEAEIRPDNGPSIGIATRCGFVKTGSNGRLDLYSRNIERETPEMALAATAHAL